MDHRRILLAVALLAAVPAAHAASESAADRSAAAFDAALDLTAADLRRSGLDMTAPAAAPVASREDRWRRERGPGFPFPFPDDRRPGPGRPDRPGPGRPDDRRDLACYGSDNGWEEHRSGHGGRGWSPRQACEECRRHHGSCRFSCSVPAYQCQAEWVGDDGSRRSYEGRPRRDRYDAEDDAVDRCRDAEWNNRTSGRCRPGDCRREEEVVDNGRC